MTQLQRCFTVLAVAGGLLAAQGCALFVVGAAAGAGIGTYSYVDNELSVIREVPLDKAWAAANGAMKDLQYTMIDKETRKDAVTGLLRGRNAQDQRVQINLTRKTDKTTEIRVRVGEFSTAANRSAGQLLYDKLNARL